MTSSLLKIKRSWNNALSYALGLNRVSSGPITAHIEVTNICNFRCVYCPQSRPETHFDILGRGKMSYGDFTTIVDRLVNTWSFRELVLTRDGEPLVHPELHRFIAYAASKGLDVTIGTNGSYLTEEKARLLIDSGLTKVKGDFCADRQKYENLRAGGNWASVLNGYRQLLEYTVPGNKRFHLVLVDLNTYDLSSPEDLNSSLNALRSLFPYPGTHLSINPAVMHNSFDQALISLSSSRKMSRPRYNRCHHPWIELVIDYKGNAVGCCRDLRSEYILGNVLDSTDIRSDIWNGPRMRHLRRQLVRKNPESISTCSKCDLPYGTSYAGRGIAGKLIRYLRR